MDEFDIMNSLDKHIFENGLLSVSDRYYKHKYCNKIKDITNIHQRVSFHTNRLCMVSLTSNHPSFKSDIKRINWKVNKNIDREKNVVSGKGKRNAQKLEQQSLICFIETTDGNTYPVYSCMQGKLIEINRKLNNNPNLLQSNPISLGYICLILPNLKMYHIMKTSMLSEEDYIREMQ